MHSICATVQEPEKQQVGPPCVNLYLTSKKYNENNVLIFLHLNQVKFSLYYQVLFHKTNANMHLASLFLYCLQFRCKSFCKLSCLWFYFRYIISEGYDFSVTNDNGRLLVQYIQKTDGETAAIQFMCRLIDVLEQSLNCAQSNILEAAKTMPSHGQCH